MEITRGEVRGVLALAAVLLALALGLFLTRSCGSSSAGTSGVIESLQSDAAAHAGVDSIAENDTAARAASSASSASPSAKESRHRRRSARPRKARSYSDRPSPLDPGQEVPER